MTARALFVFLFMVSTLLRPVEMYRETVVYDFGIE